MLTTVPVSQYWTWPRNIKEKDRLWCLNSAQLYAIQEGPNIFVIISDPWKNMCPFPSVNTTKSPWNFKFCAHQACLFPLNSPTEAASITVSG